MYAMSMYVTMLVRLYEFAIAFGAFKVVGLRSNVESFIMPFLQPAQDLEKVIQEITHEVAWHVHALELHCIILRTDN